MIGLIPRPLHAIMDYLWGIAVFFAPEMLGFKGNQAATTFCKVRGAGMIVTSLLTKFELGLIKIVPFNLHLLLDFLSAVASFPAPQILGFSKDKKASQAVIIFSAIELGTVLLSKRDKK